MRKAHICVYILSAVILLISSCKGTKETVYFKDNRPQDSTILFQDVEQKSRAKIQPNDILAINIASLSFVPEDKPSLVFLNGGLAYSPTGNVTGSSAPMGAGVSGGNSYLVDSNGFIDYPRIGKLQMGGRTIEEAKVHLTTLLKDYLKSPVVEIRIVNYKITMLGEIATPGVIYTSNHKINILDAIAQAGGIPIYGRKDNVMIIREVDGKREFARLDLNSKNVFNSPYYYLRQNDIVYVEPSSVRKQESNEFMRIYFPILTSSIGLILSIYALVTIGQQ